MDVVKQDVLPGMLIKIWFVADRIRVWNIKENKIEFLTTEEFNKLTVATNWDDAYIFKNEVISRNKKKKYWYEAASPTAQVWSGGQPVSVPQNTDSVNYVLHFYDLLCAELCGNNHFAMASRAFVMPEPMYRAWLDSKVENGTTVKTVQGEKFRKIWDKYFPHYNK